MPGSALERGAARVILEIARSGIVAVLLHRMRSAVTVACVIAMLLPYLVGIGIARGLLDQAEDSVRVGADLYVSGVRFGRSAPLPLESLAAIRAIPGVTEAVPRIVGEATLGSDAWRALIVGLPAERFPEQVRCVEGRLPRPGAALELAIGSEIARRLSLGVGAAIPPFYRNRAGERVSQVVGIFRVELPVWQAHIVLTSLESAAAIFDEQGVATDFLVSCRPGYAAAAATAIRRLPTLAATAGTGGATETVPLKPRVVTREESEANLTAGILGTEGVFTLHFVLAFAIGVPLVLVSTGFGLSERRRETGLLKAIGWRTDEVLLRGLVESLVLGTLGASLALLLACGWLEWLGGAGVAWIFLSGADLVPGFEVPFRLVPEPVLLAAVVALAVVSSGSVWSSWRAAIAAPAEAMR